MGKDKMPTTYHFRQLEHPRMIANDRVLMCPKCGEALQRPDIEGFSACPFCSYRFEPSSQLEDFIMEPVVDSWIQQQPGFTFRFMNEE